MKMSIFGMLFILIALTVGPLIYFNGGSEYLDDLLKKPAKSSVKLNKDIKYAPVTTDEKVQVFKWKDENGVWQFGSNPPPGTTGVETLTLQPNVNIMKPVEVPEAEEQQRGPAVVRLGPGSSRDGLLTKKDKKGKNGKGDDKDDFGISKDALENPYAPESISELLNTTQKLQGVLDGRAEAQNSLGK